MSLHLGFPLFSRDLFRRRSRRCSSRRSNATRGSSGSSATPVGIFPPRGPFARRLPRRDVGYRYLVLLARLLGRRGDVRETVRVEGRPDRVEKKGSEKGEKGKSPFPLAAPRSVPLPRLASVPMLIRTG